MLKPPYPFPQRWQYVAYVQGQVNENFWNVPSIPISNKIVENDNETSAPMNRNEGCPQVEADNAADNVPEEGEFYYKLQFSEEWAMKLANTVERLNRNDKEAISVSAKKRRRKR
jgi:hypothetical protein